jgi:hypothetical protein
MLLQIHGGGDGGVRSPATLQVVQNRTMLQRLDGHLARQANEHVVLDFTADVLAYLVGRESISRGSPLAGRAGEGGGGDGSVAGETVDSVGSTPVDAVPLSLPHTPQMFPAATTSGAPRLGAFNAINAQHPPLGGGPFDAAGTAGRAGTKINSGGSGGGGGGSSEGITATESQQLVCPREETEGDSDHLLQEAAEPRHVLLPRGLLNPKRRSP